LTDKKKLRAAENMIDELVKYIKTTLDINAATTILGEESDAPTGSANYFQVSKVPQTVITNPSQKNAWLAQVVP
jgi:hypothetical protein